MKKSLNINRTGATKSGKIRQSFGLFLVLAAIVFASIFLKVLQYADFRIHDWDTGIYANIVWNNMQGEWFYSDVLIKNHLGEHFSPIMILFTPFYFLEPSAAWLLSVQGIAGGVSCALIFFIGRDVFTKAGIPNPRFVAICFAICAFFYPPLAAAIKFEFHPSTIATPILALALLALHKNWRKTFVVCVVLLLSSRENAPLALLGLALYAWLIFTYKKAALALVLTAAISSALIFGLIMPGFQTAEWEHYDRLGVLDFWPDKLMYIGCLIFFLFFLPLAHWRSLICAFPLIMLNLSVSYTNQFSMKYHYDDFASVFLLVAAIHGFAAIRKSATTHLTDMSDFSAYGAN